MKLADKTQIGYIITRDNTEGTESVPCAIFHGSRYQDAADTVDAYNQLYKDKSIEGFVFKLHTSAFYD